MARTVEDVLARRTRALFLNAPAAVEMAPEVARLMAAELGHDETGSDASGGVRRSGRRLLPPGIDRHVGSESVLTPLHSDPMSLPVRGPAQRDSLVALWARVIALNTIVRTQQTTIVMNTPFQPQRSAIQPTPVPAIAEPKT